MTDTTVLDRPSRRAPPRVDESKLSQPLQDLFATWRQALEAGVQGPHRGRRGRAGSVSAARDRGARPDRCSPPSATFLASLDDKQRAAVSFPVNSEVWRHWSNIHRNVMRHGLCFAELSDRQLELAYGIMRVALGARAYETARNAMRLNEHLAELTGLPDEFGEFFYWISIFGDAVGRRALGFPDRRPPLQHQLLRARRPGGVVADAARLRAGAGGIRKI